MKRLYLGGTMSNGSQANKSILESAVYFVENTNIAYIENHTLIAKTRGTTKLHIYVNGIHTSLDIEII